MKQPLASLRKLQVLSISCIKLDRSTGRLRTILPVNELLPVDHDPGKIDMLDPNSSDNIDNLEDANRIILALKLQNSELKKSLETARQEKDKPHNFETDAKALGRTVQKMQSCAGSNTELASNR